MYSVVHALCAHTEHLAYAFSVLVKAELLCSYIGTWELVSLGLELCVNLCCIEMACGNKCESIIYIQYIYVLFWSASFRYRYAF